MTPRPFRLRRRLAGIGLGVAGWLGFVVLAAFPRLAEAVAGAGPLPILTQGLSLASGAIPLSLIELVVVGVLVRQGIGAASGFGELRKGEDRLPRLLARGGLRVAQDAGVLLFLFYLLWGVQYARPGLETHLGIEAAGEVSSEELHALAARSVEQTNLLYMEIHGSADAGEPTRGVSVAELTPGLEEAWVQVRERYDLPHRIGGRYGAPKSFLATPLVKRVGVAGMYFPFTGEALVLRDLPATSLGKALGHEMAHQRGFSSESDANVLGFLVARQSPDPLVRYSAYVFLQQQLTSALQRVSPGEARSLARERLPGVQRDLDDLRTYWNPARNVAGAAASRVNHAMLRSHGVPEGLASYQGSTWVFVALARQHGESELF